MDETWATVMVVSGGLFAGGVTSIAVERVPAWRRAELREFRSAFAHTLSRVDRLQPALLAISVASSIGYAVGAAGSARALAMLATAGFLLILVGSVAWLVPIQRRLTSESELANADVGELRSRWLRGHLVRTIGAVLLFTLTVVATTL
jgi:hypothetical protein